MSRDIELRSILNMIRATAQASDSMQAGLAESPTIAFSDAAALAQVVGLAASAIGLLSRRDELAPAAVITSEAPQSSVEIESRVKGPPALKVKVYSSSPRAAMAEARWLYDQTLSDYAEAAAKAPEKEAVNGHA